MRELVARIFEAPAPFFARKLGSAGISDPREIRGVDDLARIPLTRKQELRDSEAAHPPVGDYRFTRLASVVRIGSSTGTTGTPTLALFTRGDLWIEYESGCRSLWRWGWRPGQVVTHCHPAYLYGGGLMLSSLLEYFGMLNLWVPPPETEELATRAIRMWQRLHPDHSLVALSIHRFQEMAAKLGVDLEKDAGMPAFEFHGAGGKGLPLVTAGIECYSWIGGAAPGCIGAHLHEDWAVVQAVDPDSGREVPDGEWGNLVVTTLDRDNGMIRYDLEEACALDRAPCGCGETSIRGFWGGRFKDLLGVGGRYFQVSELEAVLARLEEVSKPTLEFQVLRPPPGAAALELRIEPSAGREDRSAVRERCANAIREALGVDASVQVVGREALPRSSYKLKRIVDAWG